MTQQELIRLLKVGVLTKELIKSLEDLLDNIEDINNYEIVDEYQKYLMHFSKRFAEKILPILENERN